MRTRGLALALLATLLAGCTAVPAPPEDAQEEPPPAEPIPAPTVEPVAGNLSFREPMRSLGHGNASGIRDFDLLVIEDRRSLERFWASHSPNGTPPPDVDLKRERLLAAVLGHVRAGCFAVTIRSATTDMDAGVTRVRFSVHEPGPDARCGPDRETPFHLVTIPKRGTPVVFLPVESRIFGCGRC